MNNKIKTAFTLIELLVVIAIIGILSGLIIVGMNSSVQSATIAKAQIFSSSLRDSMLANLVSEWKFEDSGNIGRDTWSSNNCSNVGSPAIQSTGCVYGNCLSLNGSTDYLNCLQPSALDFTNTFTISLWFKGDVFNNGLIGRHSWVGALRGYLIEVASNSMVRFATGNGTSNVYLSSTTSCSLNKWYNVVATYNNGTAKIYINGVQEASTASTYANDNTILGIGVWSAASGFFDGLIDDVRMYNAAVPTSQIEEQYYVGLNRLLAKGEINRDKYADDLFNE